MQVFLGLLHEKTEVEEAFHLLVGELLLLGSVVNDGGIRRPAGVRLMGFDVRAALRTHEEGGVQLGVRVEETTVWIGITETGTEVEVEVSAVERDAPFRSGTTAVRDGSWTMVVENEFWHVLQCSGDSCDARQTVPCEGCEK